MHESNFFTDRYLFSLLISSLKRKGVSRVYESKVLDKGGGRMRMVVGYGYIVKEMKKIEKLL